jgi:hypothetical protein
MFIETDWVFMTRAPAERNVSGKVAQVGFRFAPLERGEPFFSARSINISSLRDEEPWLDKLAEKKIRS